MIKWYRMKIDVIFHDIKFIIIDMHNYQKRWHSVTKMCRNYIYHVIWLPCSFVANLNWWTSVWTWPFKNLFACKMNKMQKLLASGSTYLILTTSKVNIFCSPWTVSTLPLRFADSGVTGEGGGAGRGRVPPRDFPSGNSWWQIRKKESRKTCTKMENVEENEQKRKRKWGKWWKIEKKIKKERSKIRNLRVKRTEKSRGPFAFQFQETNETFKGSTNMEISTGIILKSQREKIGQVTLPPPSPFSCYASVYGWSIKLVPVCELWPHCTWNLFYFHKSKFHCRFQLDFNFSIKSNLYLTFPCCIYDQSLHYCFRVSSPYT